MATFLALYHVSPHTNAPSIARVGLSPQRSQGRLQVVWLVQFDMLPWGAIHAALRHNVRLQDLDVYDVDVSSFFVKRTRWAGVFTCNQVLSPKDKRLLTDVVSPDIFT